MTGARSTLWLEAVSRARAVMYTSVVAVKPLFAPDTHYHAAMSLWFGEASKQEASRQRAQMSAVKYRV